MASKVFAALVVVALVGMFVGTIDAQGCFCTFNYDPVCGTNGKTYPNECSLGCERGRFPNLQVLRKGTCENRPSQNNNGGYLPPGRGRYN